MKRTLLNILFLMLPFLLAAQVDTAVVHRSTKMFALSEDYSELVKADFDTLITGFQEYRKIDKLTPFYSGLGNYGLPLIELDFFKRNDNYDQYIYRYLHQYMHYTGNNTFIDTQVPFTELKFTFGGPRSLAEQYFGVRHSQNVNSKLNVGLNLDVINSLGQYSYQSTDTKAFTIHSSYLGERYKAFAAWSLNNMDWLENGGIVFEDSDVPGVGDPSILTKYSTRDVPVYLGRLSSAEAKLRNRNLLLVQSYTVGRVNDEKNADTTGVKRRAGVEGKFSHILSLDRTGRSYFDDLPRGGYYDTAYITNDTNNLATFDSLFFRVLKNTLRFDFSTGENAKFRVGIGLGIRNEMNIYRQVVPTFNSSFADTTTTKNSSNALLGKIFNRIGDKFAWEANGELWFTGYRAGDFNLHGTVTKIFGEEDRGFSLTGRGRLTGTSPSWWLQNWGSNNFIWSNNFSREIRTEVGGEMNIPLFKMTISADYALLTDYIYFGKEALPLQYDGSISLITFRLQKNFSFWKFKFNNRLLVQKVSHESIIPLPLFAAKSQFFFDHEFYFKSTDGRLKMQAGAELLYNTAYYAPAYMPSSVNFYTQDMTQTGNYPYVNVFASLKLKRTRIFVAYDHVNQGFSGNNYFETPGYPMTVGTFKYGVAWTFYN